MTVAGVSYPTAQAVLGVPVHGLLAGLGIIVGAMAVRRRGRLSAAPGGLERAAGWGILAGVAGARIGFVTLHHDESASPWDVLRVWEGGLTPLFGVVAGGATVVVLLWRAGAPVRSELDVLAPALPPAFAVARVGDLVTGGHLGAPVPSGLALGYRIPPGAVLAPGLGRGPAAEATTPQGCAEAGRFYAGCTYHLVPAYEIGLALVLMAVLTYLARRPHPPGALLGTLGMTASTSWLALDPVRVVSVPPLWGLSDGQLVSIAVAGGAVGLLGWLYLGGGPPGPRPHRRAARATPGRHRVRSRPATAHLSRREPGR